MKWECPTCNFINDADYRKCNCGRVVTIEEQKSFQIEDNERAPRSTSIPSTSYSSSPDSSSGVLRVSGMLMVSRSRSSFLSVF